MSAQVPALRVSMAAILFWTVLVLVSLLRNVLTYQQLGAIEIEKRNVVTTDDDRLTLMNPAYVMREVMSS